MISNYKPCDVLDYRIYIMRFSTSPTERFAAKLPSNPPKVANRTDDLLWVSDRDIMRALN